MIIPKKSLGQNFLIDKNICIKIIGLTNINNKEVIEIGPGKGILTDTILSQKPKKLTLIEKDKELYKFLKDKYKDNKIINIINCDVLKFNFESNKNKEFIISNLPYNISIKIIIELLKKKNKFNVLIFMIQKEVAYKMDYKKNKKKNRLNFFIESVSNFNIEFNVTNNVFYPKPKVESSVVKIIPKNNLKLNFKLLEDFSREIFKFKRKKISNNLNFKNRKKEYYSKIPMNKRAEDLTNKELLNIFKYFYSD